MRAKGLGARVIVTEIAPVRALEAAMDGFSVMEMKRAAPLGDIFVTATGCRGVIDGRHFGSLKDGAILCNAGHFNVEVAMDELADASVSEYEARRNITGYILKNGRHVFAIAEGRLVNLASGDGHPAEIMDMSFAIQALSAQFLLENAASLPAGVVGVPESIDLDVARRKLASQGLSIDSLTPGQEAYLGSWETAR
jgi:adenosylhomocysteinase